MEETYTVDLTENEMVVLASVLAYTTTAKATELIRRNYGDEIADRTDYGMSGFMAYLKLYGILENEIGVRELEDKAMFGEEF